MSDMRENGQKWDEEFQRLGALEASQAAQGREIGEVKASVASLRTDVTQGFGEMRRALEHMAAANADHRAREGRTQWPVLLSAVSLLGAVMIFLWNMNASSIADLKGAMDKVGVGHIAEAEARGYARAHRAMLEERLDEVEAMALQVRVSRFTGEDGRQMRDRFDGQIDSLRDRIEEQIRTLRLDFEDHRRLPAHGGAVERLRAIEREVFGEGD